MLRAVLDTNVLLAAKLSAHPQSPNAEVITRWMAGEFIWLVSEDVLTEYAQKLLEKGVEPVKVELLLADLLQYGEEVPIRFFHFQHYPVDADDVAFLLSALNGAATHLVTYDEHLKDVGVFYPEFNTCEPLEFLLDLRTEQTQLPKNTKAYLAQLCDAPIAFVGVGPDRKQTLPV